MIKTGDWTTAELIKYLVAVQSTLAPVELDRLRLTAAFLKESPKDSVSTDQGVTRYKASDLYEPSDVFRKLGLPIIAWGEDVKWKSNSEEGMNCVFVYCVLNLLGNISEVFVPAGTAAPSLGIDFAEACKFSRSDRAIQCIAILLGQFCVSVFRLQASRSIRSCVHTRNEIRSKLPC